MHKITKLKEVDGANYPAAPSHDEYRDGLQSLDDKFSPNVDYWIIGELIQPPSIGHYVVVDRWVRNGVAIRGVFHSSLVTKITEDGFETQNSVYRLEEVADEDILDADFGKPTLV
jgi:hypothetical protein